MTQKIYWTILFAVLVFCVLTVWQTNREYNIAQVALYEAQIREVYDLTFSAPIFTSHDKTHKILGVLTGDESEIIAFILKTARQYGVDEKKFLDVAICESGLIPQQSKIIHNGRRENSWGIFQINLTAHPEVTKEQAMDIEWSTLWAAQQWVAGHADWWTCYDKSY